MLFSGEPVEKYEDIHRKRPNFEIINTGFSINQHYAY
jgi:hypothetical protein